jgi:5'-nucleotidase
MTRILVTNDDSINANGLAVLVESLRPLGDITVVAPSTEMSGAGHSITLSRPLRIRKHRGNDNWFAVDGTPTDCVALALHWMFKDGPRPDLVVSGINRGANLGDAVTYSGTVAGALEASLNDIPSIAVSLVTNSDADYHPAAQFTARLAEKVLAEGLPRGTLLNVNVPKGPVLGYRVVPTGSKPPCGEIIESHDPRGRPYYWIGLEPETDTISPDTDHHVIREGLVSITPLRNDLTDRDALARLREGFSL